MIIKNLMTKLQKSNICTTSAHTSSISVTEMNSLLQDWLLNNMEEIFDFRPIFETWPQKVNFLNNDWNGRKHLSLRYRLDETDLFHPHVLEIETDRWSYPVVVDGWSIFHKQLDALCTEQFANQMPWFFKKIRSPYLIQTSGETIRFHFKRLEHVTVIKMMFQADADYGRVSA